MATFLEGQRLDIRRFQARLLQSLCVKPPVLKTAFIDSA